MPDGSYESTKGRVREIYVKRVFSLFGTVVEGGKLGRMQCQVSSAAWIYSCAARIFHAPYRYHWLYTLINLGKPALALYMWLRYGKRYVSDIGRRAEYNSRTGDPERGGAATCYFSCHHRRSGTTGVSTLPWRGRLLSFPVTREPERHLWQKYLHVGCHGQLPTGHCTPGTTDRDDAGSPTPKCTIDQWRDIAQRALLG